MFVSFTATRCSRSTASASRRIFLRYILPIHVEVDSKELHSLEVATNRSVSSAEWIAHHGDGIDPSKFGGQFGLASRTLENAKTKAKSQGGSFHIASGWESKFNHHVRGPRIHQTGLNLGRLVNHVRMLNYAAKDYVVPAENDWQQDERYFDLDEHESEAGDEQIYVEPPEVYIPVEAVFMARSVDLKALAQEKSLDVTLSRNHLIIKYKDEPVETDEESGIPTIDCWNTERYMVIFHYGTAVLFNFGSGRTSKEEEYLKIVKLHSKGGFDEPKRENYCVVVKPTLQSWSQGALDKIMVKELDVNGIRIVSLILSQSVALDHYTRQIDSMLKSFDDLNHDMELTGTFSLKRKELFKLVASVNTALAEAILRVGLLERSDVAWQNANYDSIFSYMREEFELEERFESLEFKTGIIQHNVAFFLGILQNRKSDALEWIIIVLIAGDMCVSLYQILHGL